MGGNTGDGHHPAIAGVSGAIATIVNEAIMTPVDVIKQRLQVGGGVEVWRQGSANTGVSC